RPTPPAATPPIPPRNPAIPRKPTDSRRADVLAGRITRGGSGPCYGLTTDDGRQYALHGPDVGTFRTGTTVFVTVAAVEPGTDCGPGTPARIVTIRPVG
ncbi:hypothetical protein, partial [Micromonospora sp. KC723]|uniref:hypothetical protein n=1 Tax=Micromonospora sp. KC723 TaxID=2530381 RepID=UPI00105077B7